MDSTRYGTHLCNGLMLRLAVAVAVVAASQPVLLEVARANSSFVVNSIGDQSDFDLADGICRITPALAAVDLCTLRAALEQANATEGLDKITFSLLGPGPHVIAPGRGLPSVKDPVVIDGVDESIFCPGFDRACLASAQHGSAAPGVEITPAGGSGWSGLVFDQGAAGSIVRWLSVTKWSWGIVVWSDDTTIEKSYIGLRVRPVDEVIEPAGNKEMGISAPGVADGQIPGVAAITISNLTIQDSIVAANRFGIHMSQVENSRVRRNVIGAMTKGSGFENTSNGIGISSGTGNTVGPANIIVGNFTGVAFYDGTADSVVTGNQIGVTPWGEAAGNAGGVAIAGTNNVVGGPLVSDRNVISGNAMGVSVHAPTLIQGNYIGTDASGTKAVPNKFNGIDIQNASGGEIKDNLISGNGFDGIRILAFTGDATGHEITGNLIGTDHSGLMPIPNERDGISITSMKPRADDPTPDVWRTANAAIGGASTADRNVIAGNGVYGVELFGRNATGTTIFDNYIGLGSDGVSPLPNGLDSMDGGGVALHEGAHHNTIGSVEGPNKIWFNNGPGVVATNEVGIGNTLSANSIGRNGELGIELVKHNAGVTSNDAGDIDTGPNDHQNFPVLHRAEASAASIVIDGTLSSRSATTYSIEFFSNDECDGSGHGEAERFIGSVVTATTGSGEAAFSVALPVSVPLGQAITATATDALGNTSELSECQTVESG